MKLKSFLLILVGVLVIGLLAGFIFTLQGCGQAPEEPGELDGQVLMSFNGEFYIAHQRYMDSPITLSWITPKKALELLAENEVASEELAEKLGVNE